MNRGRRAVRLAAVPVALLLLASGPGLAEVITIEQAVELAFEKNLSLEAACLDYQAANWSLRGARASLFPSVRLSSSAVRVDPDTYQRANASLEMAEEFGMDVEPFLYETTYETGFDVTVPIWNGGKLWGAVGVAGGVRDAALRAYESERRAVKVAAESTYFDVLRSEALVRVAREAAAAAAGNARTAERKFDIGLVNRAEFLRWQVLLANEERALADAENRVEIARTRLSNVLGLPLDSELELVDVSRSELDVAIDALSWILNAESISEEWARELLADNPDFLALADAEKIRRHNLSIARGAFMPCLNASGSYGWRADDDIALGDDTAWSAALVLDLPIFTSFQNVSDYQNSKKSYLAAVSRREDAERSMVAALRNTAATLKTCLKALEASETRVAQAEEFLKNVTNRHEQGMTAYTEFVDARIIYDSSRADCVNALYDCFVAFAEMERLVGEQRATTPGE